MSYCEQLDCANKMPCVKHVQPDVLVTFPDELPREAIPLPFVLLAQQKIKSQVDFDATTVVQTCLSAVADFSNDMKAQSTELETCLSQVKLGDLTEKVTSLHRNIRRFRTGCESFARNLQPTVKHLIRAVKLYPEEDAKTEFQLKIVELSAERVDNPLGGLLSDCDELISEVIELLPLLRAKVTNWWDRLKAVLGKMIESSGKLCRKIALALGTALALGCIIPGAGIAVGAFGLVAVAAKPIYDMAMGYSKIRDESKEIEKISKTEMGHLEVLKRVGSLLKQVKSDVKEIELTYRFGLETPHHRDMMLEVLQQLEASLESLLKAGSDLVR